MLAEIGCVSVVFILCFAKFAHTETVIPKLYDVAKPNLQSEIDKVENMQSLMTCGHRHQQILEDQPVLPTLPLPIDV
jgi:hypothetical protein